MSAQDESSEDWAALLAQSLVARSPLPEPAAQALKFTFSSNEGGATELRWADSCCPQDQHCRLGSAGPLEQLVALCQR